MPTGLEAAADIATGSLIGRAIEPEAGERGGHVHGTDCLNCSTLLNGSYCASCGQKAQIHRTLKAFGNDFLHSVLHFDGKIWRTLPLLFWKPGELTRRYVHGERTKFVSPLALFLFMVFFSFATFNWLAPNSYDVEPNSPVSAASEKKDIEDSKQELLSGLKELEAAKQKAIADKAPVGSYSWIDGEIARQQTAITKLETSNPKEFDRTLVADRKISIEKSKVDAEIERLEKRIAEDRKLGRPTKDLEDQLKGVRIGSDMMGNAKTWVGRDKNDNSDMKFNIMGIKSFEDAAKQASENPQLLAYKVQSNTYKFSWALIPISLPFMWLLFFWKRQFKMFDHAVFVTYSLCFMMVLGSIGALIIGLSDEGSAPFVLTVLALIFVPPLHIYRQLHRAYQTSRFGAIIRTFLLSAFALMALTLFAMLILALGVTG